MILQLRKQVILLLLVLACWTDSLEGRQHPRQKRRGDVLRGRRHVRALVSTSEDPSKGIDGKGMTSSNGDGVAKESNGKDDGKEGSKDWRQYIETGNSLDAKASAGMASSVDKERSQQSMPTGSSSSGDSKSKSAASNTDKKSSKHSKTSENIGASATRGTGTSKTFKASKQSHQASSDDDHKKKLSSKSNNSKGSKTKSKSKSSRKLSKRSQSSSNKAKQMKLTKKASSVKGNSAKSSSAKGSGAKANSAKEAAEASMKASSKDEPILPSSGDEGPAASGDESMVPPSGGQSPATDAPVETTDAPDLPITDVPVATDSPIVTTDAPATEAPVVTDAPVMTVAPTEALTDAVVVEETVAPTEALTDAAVVEETVVPTEVTITEPPVTTTAPTEAVTEAVVDANVEPTNAVTEVPVESTLAPSEEIDPDDDFFTVPNDICVDAIELELGDIVFGSTGSATGNEGVDACDDAVASLFPEASDGFSIQQLGVWYAVEASDTRLRASVCSDTGSELAPMILTIYAGNDNCSELACAPVYNTASCSVEWMASSDYEMYYILVQSLVVEGTPLDVETDLEFELRLSEPLAPRNDICEESVMLEYGDTIAGQTLSASAKDIESACALELQPPSSNVLIPAVWFSVAGNGNSLIASTCNESTGSGPILVTIYSGSCDSLVCETLDVSDVGPCSSGIASTVEGQTYYVVVEKVLRGNDAGIFELAINDPE